MRAGPALTPWRPAGDELSDTRQRSRRRSARLDRVIDEFVLASAEFERVLRNVRQKQWERPTPCPEWNVRQLVNHMTRGNLNYVALSEGGTAADFLRMRDVDALGTDPVDAFVRSAAQCARAFGESGALQRILDYPLGRISGRQALTVRTTDSTIHTWDLAQALDVDAALRPELVSWISDHLDEIYADLAETPTDPESTHKFFAAPTGPPGVSEQERLLQRMGRSADWRSDRAAQDNLRVTAVDGDQRAAVRPPPRALR